jgi:hypothetical protein
MDDKRLFALIFRSLFVLGLVVATTAGHCLEHISLRQISEVAAHFNNQVSVGQHATLLKSSWNCEMYGAQSRLQVRRNAKLYQFESNAEGNLYFNHGAHVLSEYKLSDQGLTAKTDKFVEIIKIKNHNQLISRLSTNSQDPIVISYAICVRI